MRLIRCHIEGFGAFSQQEFTFDANLTEFCRHNGWGKTTLADFITAMLYGLSTTRDKGSFSKRQRYLPFGGGKFGGTLVLDVDGKEWRIERTFDAKSETKDTVTVYCGTEVVPMTRSEVGLRLLGVDETTFARVSLIGDEQLDIGDNQQLGNKLQATLDDTPDSHPYEAIMAELSNLIKALQPQRRSQNNPGKIPLCKDSISRLEEALRNQRATADALPLHYAEYRAIEARIAELEARIATIRAYDLRLQTWETYQRYLADAEKAKEELCAWGEKYPEGFPSQQELEQLKDLDRERIELEAQSGTLPLVDGGERLAALRKRYPTGLPTDEELSAAKAELEQYEASKSKLVYIETESDVSLDPAIQALFVGGTPSDAELANMDALAKEIHAIEEKVQANTAAETALTTKNKPIGLIGGLIGGGALLAVVGGILSGGNLGLGLALMILGVGSLIGGVLVAVLQKGSGVDHSRIFALQSEKNEKINALRNLLIPYRLGSNPLADYAHLCSSLGLYRQYTEQGETKRARLAQCRAKIDEAKASLVALLGGYVTFGDNLRADVERLAQDKIAMEQLAEAEKRHSQTKTALSEKLRVNAQEIARLVKQYRLVVRGSLQECIEELQCDFTTYQQTQKSCKELYQNARDFAAAEGLTEPPAPIEGDVKQLQSEQEALHRAQADKKRHIEECEQEIADLVEREEALAAEKERLATLTEQLELLTMTRDMIEQAEKNIVDRYVGPVRQTLSDYLKKVELVLGESFSLDKNFSLQYETGGVLRPEEHLSAGQRALCGLCFRLAILPHLYQGKHPFVLLDDPFATVDEAYMDKAREMLKELSKEMQIVYFCCHESRSIQ